MRTSRSRLMEPTHDEVILLLSGNRRLNKQTMAHSKAMQLSVNIQEQSEISVSATLYGLILENSEMEPEEFLDDSHPMYREEVVGKELSKDEWVRILTQRPTMLRAPVAIKGEEIAFCDSPARILELDVE